MGCKEANFLQIEKADSKIIKDYKSADNSKSATIKKNILSNYW